MFETMIHSPINFVDRSMRETLFIMLLLMTKQDNKNSASLSHKIITKALIINYLSDLLCPDEIDKHSFCDLVTILFGILLHTQHNSTKAFHETIPGSRETSNLNKSLHAQKERIHNLHLSTILSCILWCRQCSDIRPGTPVYLSLDETFIEKSKKQKSLRQVYYCGNKKKYGFYLVAAHIQIGKYHFPGGYFVHYPKETTKQQLALELVSRLKGPLSSFTQVTVLSDSAYAEKMLMSYVIHECKWTWIGAVKRNRKADGKSVSQRFKYMSNEKYESVGMYKRRFLATSFKGFLSESSQSGLFVVTKTRKKSYTPVSWRYYYCSNPSLTVHEVLRQYEHRWRIENDFWTLKEHLSMDDFRYRDEETVETYLNLVFLTYIWICHSKNVAVKRKAKQDIFYGVCDMLVHLRTQIRSFLNEHGTKSLEVLFSEFIREHSRKRETKQIYETAA